MQRNMKQWVADTIAAPTKKPMPILSFPSVQLLGVPVPDLISDSDLQAKGMKAVAERTPSGATVSLMDLSVEAECFGSKLWISDEEVPTITGTIVKDLESAEALAVPPVGAARSGLYIQAIEKALALITDRPVLAGVVGPYSLASRLMGVTEIMIWCYDDPDMVACVLDKVTQFSIAYCKAYKEAGANGVVIAEPLAGLLEPEQAAEFSHPYVKRIIDSVQDDHFAVFYHNCGDNVPLMLEGIYALGAMGYHFGDAITMADVVEQAPKDALIMGNVSPSAEFCNGTPESIRQATLAVMKACCHCDNFVISSGCDIPPASSWENIDAFFRAAEEYYR